MPAYTLAFLVISVINKLDHSLSSHTRQSYDAVVWRPRDRPGEASENVIIYGRTRAPAAAPSV